MPTNCAFYFNSFMDKYVGMSSLSFSWITIYKTRKRIKFLPDSTVSMSHTFIENQEDWI